MHRLWSIQFLRALFVDTARADIEYRLLTLTPIQSKSLMCDMMLIVIMLPDGG